MSAWPAQLGGEPGGRSRVSRARAPALSVRALAFFGLSAFCSAEYATLLLHPQLARVLAVAAIAAAAGALLAQSGTLRGPRWLRAALRGLLLVLALALALAAIGVPWHLLAPERWPRLARELHRGYLGLAGWLWPYRGGAHWSRVAVLSPLAPALLASATLCFWPSRRGTRTRAVAALALLVALFVAGAANQSSAPWGLEGFLLAVLIGAWLWLGTLRGADAARAAWWLAACVALALLGASALGSRRAWIDLRSWNPVALTTAFQWDDLYGPIPWSRSTGTILEVSEVHPNLLRVTALDRFDGVRFLRSDAPPASPALDLAGARERPSWREQATITLTGLRSDLLVSGGGLPLSVGWLSAQARPLHLEADGTARVASGQLQDVSYQVSSYAPAPSTAQLRGAGRRFPRAYLPYTQFELPDARASALRAPDLAAEARARPSPSAVVRAPTPGVAVASDATLARRVEASPYGPMFALARRLEAGARTSYDVAVRLQRFLVSGFVYDERTPLRRYPLEAFLFSDRRGYCQQFAGAMTLMLRMDGIPARVAAGFTPGTFDTRTGTWQVSALDAHEWVEVYFAGIGWVPFDPTPPRPIGAQGVALPVLASKALITGRAAPARVGVGPASPATSGAHAGRPGGAAGWLPLVLAACALALATGVGLWWMAGWRRLRRALCGDGGGAVCELRVALARLGRPVAPATTLAQLERGLALARAKDAARYVSMLRALRYGDGRGPARADRARLRRALAAGTGRLGRLRALAALPPGAARRS